MRDSIAQRIAYPRCGGVRGLAVTAGRLPLESTGLCIALPLVPCDVTQMKPRVSHGVKQWACRTAFKCPIRHRGDSPCQMIGQEGIGYDPVSPPPPLLVLLFAIRLSFGACMSVDLLSLFGVLVTGPMKRRGGSPWPIEMNGRTDDWVMTVVSPVPCLPHGCRRRRCE